MTRAALSLGANLGDRLAALQSAVDRFADRTRVVAVSGVYATDPVGGPEQPEYLNAVLVVETGLAADEILNLAQSAERERLRERTIRWGPRTLDVDVLAVGDLVQDDERLTLPHPRALQRAFVMVPWAEADPDFQVPGRGLTVASAARSLDPAGIRRTELTLRTVGE